MKRSWKRQKSRKGKRCKRRIFVVVRLVISFFIQSIIQRLHLTREPKVVTSIFPHPILPLVCSVEIQKPIFWIVHPSASWSTHCLLLLKLCNGHTYITNYLTNLLAKTGSWVQSGLIFWPFPSILSYPCPVPSTARSLALRFTLLIQRCLGQTSGIFLNKLIH